MIADTEQRHTSRDTEHSMQSMQSFSKGEVAKSVYKEVEDLLQAKPQEVQRAHFDGGRWKPPPKRKNSVFYLDITFMWYNNM